MSVSKQSVSKKRVSKKSITKKKPVARRAKIGVDLDLYPGANPNVLICSRKARVASRTTIQWAFTRPEENYSFTDFNPKEEPFKNVKVRPDKIVCDFDGGSVSTTNEHAYTITVKHGRKEYSSDIHGRSNRPGGRTHGRAVIRN